MDIKFTNILNQYLNRLSILGFDVLAVTSAQRSIEENKIKGGIATSKHLIGQAEDIVFKKSIPDWIINLCKYKLDLDVIYNPTKNYYHIELEQNGKYYIYKNGKYVIVKDNTKYILIFSSITIIILIYNIFK